MSNQPINLFNELWGVGVFGAQEFEGRSGGDEWLIRIDRNQKRALDSNKQANIPLPGLPPP